MTLREIFDKAKAHLLAQNQRAIIPGLGCAYRTPSGLKCAIGACIPDDKYEPWMEGTAVGAVPTGSEIPDDYLDGKYKPELIREILGCDNAPALAQLQSIHDSNSPRYWPKLLDAFEKEFLSEPTV